MCSRKIVSDYNNGTENCIVSRYTPPGCNYCPPSSSTALCTYTPDCNHSATSNCLPEYILPGTFDPSFYCQGLCPSRQPCYPYYYPNERYVDYPAWLVSPLSNPLIPYSCPYCFLDEYFKLVCNPYLVSLLFNCCSAHQSNFVQCQYNACNLCGLVHSAGVPGSEQKSIEQRPSAGEESGGRRSASEIRQRESGGEESLGRRSACEEQRRSSGGDESLGRRLSGSEEQRRSSGFDESLRRGLSTMEENRRAAEDKESCGRRSSGSHQEQKRSGSVESRRSSASEAQERSMASGKSSRRSSLTGSRRATIQEEMGE